MPSYFSPGVYVEEVPGGARPIGPVGTSTAGFVGVAPNPDAPVNRAVAVNNWTEFVAKGFGLQLAPSSAGGLSFATGNARVTATTACFGPRPVANALGAGDSMR